jgi:hypothetical protein
MMPQNSANARMRPPMKLFILGGTGSPAAVGKTLLVSN